MSIPLVFFSEQAMQKAKQQIKRMFDKGWKTEKVLWESAMYPLGTIIPKLNKSPLEILELSEIESVIIIDVLYPPDRFNDFGPNYAKFKPGTNEYFVPLIEKRINQYPLLEIFCKLHSHTFKGSRLSRGDIQGHILNAVDWFRAKGLNTMFSFLVYPDKDEFFMKCFAPDKNAKLVKIPIEIISVNDKMIKYAKSQPYYKTKRGEAWCNKNWELLKEKYKVVRNNFKSFGWRKYIISIAHQEYVMAIPPQFPKRDIRVYLAEYQSGSFVFQLISLPQWWPESRKLSDYNLVTLADWLKDPPLSQRGVGGKL